MIFARNWGDEGFCSGDPAIETLPAELRAVRILIPQPKVTGGEVTGVDISSDFNSFDTADCPTAIYIKGRGLLLTFNAPTVSFPTVPVRRPLIEGEVHLEWHMTGAIAAPEVVACDPQLRELFREDQKEMERVLIGRILKVKERFEYFETERAQERDLFHPRNLPHCVALSGPVAEGSAPPSNVNSFTMLTATGNMADRSRLAAARRRGTAYNIRRRRVMLRSLHRFRG